ncbi:MAG: hypothetical protein WC548_04155 [Candidatus Pacearchaeota archaeon]
MKKRELIISYWIAYALLVFGIFFFYFNREYIYFLNSINKEFLFLGIYFVFLLIVVIFWALIKRAKK